MWYKWEFQMFILWDCITIKFKSRVGGSRVGLGEVVKSINTGYELTAGMTKPQWFCKVSGNPPRHESIPSARPASSRGLDISGLASLLPCVIGNGGNWTTTRGTWLPSQKVLLSTSPYKMGGFFPCLLLSSTSQGCFSGGSGRSSNAEEGRSPPLQEEDSMS